MFRASLIAILVLAAPAPAQAATRYAVEVGAGFPVFTAEPAGRAPAARPWTGRGPSLGLGGPAASLFGVPAPTAAVELPWRFRPAAGVEVHVAPNVAFAADVTPGVSLAVVPDAGRGLAFLAEERLGGFTSLAGTTTFGLSAGGRGGAPAMCVGASLGSTGVAAFSAVAVGF